MTEVARRASRASRALRARFADEAEAPFFLRSQVTRGARFVLSFWFTCDASRHYETFLDGRVRYTYGQGDEL